MSDRCKEATLELVYGAKCLVECCVLCGVIRDVVTVVCSVPCSVVCHALCAMHVWVGTCGHVWAHVMFGGMVASILLIRVHRLDRHGPFGLCCCVTGLIA